MNGKLNEAKEKFIKKEQISNFEKIQNNFNVELDKIKQQLNIN